MQVTEGIARLSLWMRYHGAGATTLAPRSGLNDLITPQNWRSGAGRTADLLLFSDGDPRRSRGVWSAARAVCVQQRSVLDDDRPGLPGGVAVCGQVS